MSQDEVIVRIVVAHYPTTQAIYLFGSYGTADEWPDSDVDIALLLPAEQTSGLPHLALTPCHHSLQDTLGKSVDLLNAREISTVLQKEIIASGRVLYCADDDAVAEFEMLTLSHYQKLNDERKAILESFAQTGRAYDV